MVLGKEFSINVPEAKFSFTPRYKFSVILGESGNGKSYLIDTIGNNAFFTNIRRFASSADMGLINNPSEFLIAFDEVDFNWFLRIHGQTVLNESPNAFLIVSRTIPKSIPLHWRAIYEMIRSPSRNYSVRQLFIKYWEFENSDTVYTEDSGSGHQYFKNYLVDSNVLSINGKYNALDIVDEDATLIADGAVFGQILQALVNRKSKLKIFLPDSFEALILEHTPRAAELVANSRTDSVLQYFSLERYYSDNIRKYYQTYSKSKLPDVILKKDLLKFDYYQHPYFERFGILGDRAKYAELERLSKIANGIQLKDLLNSFL